MRLEDRNYKKSPRSLFIQLPENEKQNFKSTRLLQSHDTVLWLLIFASGLMAIVYTIWFYYTTDLFLFNTSHGQDKAYFLQFCFILIVLKFYSKLLSIYYSYKWFAFLLNQKTNFFDDIGKSTFKSRYRHKLTILYAEKFVDQYFLN